MKIQLVEVDQAPSKAQSKKYSVVLSDIQFKAKPRAFKQLHDELDNKQAQEYTLQELLEEVTQGKTFKNGSFIKPLSNDDKRYIKHWINNNPSATKEEVKRKIRSYKKTIKPILEASDLAILDIDDVLGKTDPEQVMIETGAIALYYTFSHNEKSPINTTMHRYRLLFDLSEKAQGKEQLEFIQQAIKDRILKKYPYLHAQKFKNKAHGIDNLTKMFYGTDKGYLINEHYKTVEVSELIQAHESEKEFNKLLIQLHDLNARKHSTNDSEILDMANFLGDMNDVLDHKEWTTLSIGLWNTAQINDISDEIVIEALQTLDGYKQPESYYLGFKRPINNQINQATIGTLIKLATDKGYKRKYRQEPDETTETDLESPVTTHKIEKYIDELDLLELLENDERKILVVSDTNTGKTRASLTASKEYLKQHKKAFIYVALPTKALSEQVAESYQTNKAILGNLNVKKAVQKAISNDTRLLVGTYDKTPLVTRYLSDYEVIVIADEVHKEVSDYSYRYRAIQNLFDVKADKFIGLTGTPSELDLSNYDSLHIFELKEPKILADTLQFILYTQANEYERITAQAIEQEVKQGNKVLAFINNKKVISKLARVLRKQGLKVATVTADNLRSKTYRSILNNQKIDDEIDVVLTTIVLADGININNTKDHVLMIAPSHYKHAQFYNIDMIRQASNRFRNPYNKILIPLYINQEIATTSQHERANEQAYNLESQYNHLYTQAQVTKAIVQSEFKEKMQDYTPSTAERIAGLFRPKEVDDFNFKQAYKNKRLMEQGLNYDEQLQNELEQLEAKLFEIDKRSIRQQASKDKERYYSLYPYAFKSEITRVLDVLEVSVLTTSEYFLSDDERLKTALEELDKLDLKSEQDKRLNLRNILHELIFHKVQNKYFETGKVDESLDEWKTLKKYMNNMQYHALTELVRFLDYDRVINELEYIQKKAQTYELVRQFKAIQELESYRETTAETVTELIFKEIETSVVNRSFMNSKERDGLLEQLAKDFKVKKRYTIAKRKELFKQVFNKYFITDTATVKKVDGKSRKFTTYKVIELDDIAEKRNLNSTEIKRMYDNFLYM